MQYPTRPQVPNPYQIIGQAAQQVGSDVRQFGKEQDELAERFRLMMEKRAQAEIENKRYEEKAAMDKADADRKAKDFEAKTKRDTDRQKFFARKPGAEGADTYSPMEIRNALATGLIDANEAKALQPEKPSFETVGGGGYERQPDGSYKQVIAPKPDAGTAPQIIQTNEGVFRIDKNTGQAIPVTGPQGALGGKKSFAPEEIARAKGSYSSSESALDRLAAEATAIMNDPALGRITGVVGAFPNIPGTGASDVEARLETLKSQAGFNVLQNMRDMSKTGGALGNVSNFEIQALQNNLSALDTKQSPEAFRASLQRIIDFATDSKNRLGNAYKEQYGEDAPSIPSSIRRPSSQGGEQIVDVQTPEQARSLPPGTRFRTPDGRVKVR